MKKSISLATHLWLVLGSLMSTACGYSTSYQKEKNNNTMNTHPTTIPLERATLGAGCFWCVEAVFQQLKGVEKVVSGYSGGTVKNPSYKEVCTGNTGHAEVVQISYNPQVISFEELLEVFFQVHDPTTLNRQGNDVGTQYRSVIFYHNEKQKETAEKIIAALQQSGAFAQPIVTEIAPATDFYVAEDYHQNYYNENQNKNPYCAFVVKPKVEKFQKVFKDKLK